MSVEKNELIYLYLKYGKVVIETRTDIAPNHVKRIINLISEGQYDGVVFHRVIESFMAQTGDVEFGNSNNKDFNLSFSHYQRKNRNQFDFERYVSPIPLLMNKYDCQNEFILDPIDWF